MFVDEPADALAVGLALLGDDPVELRVGGREGDEVADDQLRGGDGIDAGPAGSQVEIGHGAVQGVRAVDG